MRLIDLFLPKRLWGFPQSRFGFLLKMYQSPSIFISNLPFALITQIMELGVK